MQLSYQCGVSDEPLFYETIGQCFDRVVSQYPDKEAVVVVHQNIRWNYKEYHQRVNQLAAGLLNLGIEPGDRIGIWSPNCIEWCLVQIASAKIGAILVCINPAYRTHELEYALNKSGCKAILCASSYKSSNYLDMLLELAPEISESSTTHFQSKKLPSLEIAISLDDKKRSGFLQFSEVCSKATEQDYETLAKVGMKLEPDQLINIQFTSGTTGSPKGATLSHFNILNNASQVAQQMSFGSRDRLCIPVPLYHCFGLVLGSLVCLTSGATAVYPNASFDAQSTLRTISDESCTAVHGVPTMFIEELELLAQQEYNLSSLRTGIMSGAPCPMEIMKRVISEMNISEIMIVYGQTETSPVNHLTASNDSLELRVGSVGRVAPHLEAKIIDEEGQIVPIGQKGEICCRGYAVMQGYWQDTEKTKGTVDAAGWLHSGDLAIMDKNGYVKIVGRKNDMIIRGGENIYPREIEEFLYTHDSVKEVQVFGVDDERLGEEVCAWIQCREDYQLSASEIKDYCKDKISHFKIPKHIKFVEEYPMTVSGKIQKFKMRQAMLEDLK